MRPLIKKSLILLIWLACLLAQGTGVFAAGTRSVTPEQWDKLTSDKAFGYKNEIENIPPPQNVDPNIFEKLFRAFFGFFGSGIGTFIIWALLACVVVYVIYRLFFSSDSFLFRKNNKIMKSGGTPKTDDEDLATADWETLLQNAASKNDQRLAIRYSYMWLLQLLQRRGLIQYRIDKTNYEYYTELNETQYKQAFKQLSRQYEYAWYGRFAVPSEKYNEHISLFNQMKKQLS